MPIVEQVNEKVTLARRTDSDGSGGSGDSNELQGRLVSELELSLYGRVSPNIFAVVGQDFVDSDETDANFSIIDNAYSFGNIGDTLTSLNLVDHNIVNEFNFDINKLRLDVYWAREAFDDAASYEVSRDGGNNWQAIELKKVFDSDAAFGEMTFDDELTNSFEEIVGTQDELVDLDGDLSSAFSVENPTVVKKIDTVIEVSGNPIGLFKVKIVKDNGGSPSADLKDLISVKTVSVQGLTTGALELGTYAMLPTGDYHLVISPDNTYLDEFTNSSGANKLEFAHEAGEGIVYSLEGREIDVRVKVTGATEDSKLLGFGIFWQKKTEARFVENTQLRYVEKFLSNTDNKNVFELPFLPHKLLLEVHVFSPNTARFRYGDFSLDGKKVVFPENKFQTANDEEIAIEFYQVGNVNTIDMSDANSALLAANHLGSTDPQIDQSVAGRGVFLRRPDGTLREITINNDDDFDIYSV